jgi:hypothetical protein
VLHFLFHRPHLPAVTSVTNIITMLTGQQQYLQPPAIMTETAAITKESIMRGLMTGGITVKTKDTSGMTTVMSTAEDIMKVMNAMSMTMTD